MHGHSHHDHAHGHQHRGDRFGRAFAIGIALNLGFVIVEAVFGFTANSMALLSDAGHNLSDVLGLFVAWGGGALALRGSSARFTYGLKKASILAALANALFLLIAVGAIGLEAIRRLFHPEPTHGGVVMIVAGVGISAILGMIALISFTLSITNLAKAQASSQPLVTIAEAWLPTGVVRVFVFLVAFSMFALCVVTVAAAGRLVFSLGRDNMLPASRKLATVDRSTQTPIVALDLSQHRQTPLAEQQVQCVAELPLDRGVVIDCQAPQLLYGRLVEPACDHGLPSPTWRPHCSRRDRRRLRRR